HVHGGNNLGYQGRAPTPFLFSGTPRAPSATGDGERHRRPSFTHLRVAPPGAMVSCFSLAMSGRGPIRRRADTRHPSGQDHHLTHSVILERLPDGEGPLGAPDSVAGVG